MSLSLCRETRPVKLSQRGGCALKAALLYLCMLYTEVTHAAYTFKQQLCGKYHMFRQHRHQFSLHSSRVWVQLVTVSGNTLKLQKDSLQPAAVWLWDWTSDLQFSRVIK